MVCQRVGRAIVCSRPRRRFCSCGARAELLCDFPKDGGGTCSKAVCEACRRPGAAPGEDYCQAHDAPPSPPKAVRKAAGEARPQARFPGFE